MKRGWGQKFIAFLRGSNHLQTGSGTSSAPGRARTCNPMIRNHVERLVSDSHRATTQLDRSASLIQYDFIVLKPASRRRTLRLPSAVGRPSRCTCYLVCCSFPTSGSVQDTNWTESAIGRGIEFRAADRTGAWFLRHGSRLCTEVLYGFSRFCIHGFGSSFGGD
jgi:hypothetical protein